MSGCPAGLSGMVRNSGGPLAGMRRMGEPPVLTCSTPLVSHCT